ncbi:MAG: basic amino acid/polyamine antiporter, family [Pyrinomonadaceae bacterium]|jgi:APA family basic amino acid/polyamine antiporter|nr:basic amino acid/polyamine antiporter, family [Pyrinomonadaceae bacterium]
MTSSPALKRQIGFWTGVTLIVGEVIAVGIFLTPAGMAKSLGSPFWLLVIWLMMGGMALCGALCYGELAARFPEAGGGYVYLREAYGRPVAFLYGWMALLVMDPGITAALAVGLASYFGYIFKLSPSLLKVVAIASILSAALLNIRGVKLGGTFVRWLTILKLGLLAVVILWGFGTQAGNWSNFKPLVDQRADSEPLLAALAGGIVGAFFSFGGWWDLNKVAGEVRDPERTLPRALIYGVTILTAVYILTSAAFLYLVPLQQITSGETFVAQAGEALFGRLGGQALSIIVIVAVMGSLVAVTMSAPRVYFAMARDGLFIPAAAAIHSRYGTPARAILVQAMLASVLVLVGTFNTIISYFIFVVVIFIALTVGALFVLRRKASDATAYRTPGYPATPIIFLLLIVLLLFLLVGHNPKQALLGVGVVALGLPVYYFLFRRAAPNVD